jgi:hypothetical protein
MLGRSSLFQRAALLLMIRIFISCLISYFLFPVYIFSVGLLLGINNKENMHYTIIISRTASAKYKWIFILQIVLFLISKFIYDIFLPNAPSPFWGILYSIPPTILRFVFVTFSLAYLLSIYVSLANENDDPF